MGATPEQQGNRVPHGPTGHVPGVRHAHRGCEAPRVRAREEPDAPVTAPELALDACREKVEPLILVLERARPLGRGRGRRDRGSLDLQLIEVVNNLLRTPCGVEVAGRLRVRRFLVWPRVRRSARLIGRTLEPPSLDIRDRDQTGRVLALQRRNVALLGGRRAREPTVATSERVEWPACRKGLLDKKLMKKTAQLLLAIKCWRGEILAFGKHAIEALRDETGAHCSLLGDQYGLSAPRYAFTNGSAVVVGFVHPQNLLASWSGGRTAAAYAGIVDTYARRHCAREGRAPPTTAVEVWVATHVAQMSPGQRDFERLAQMRSDEKHSVRNGGAITPFGGLPIYVQLALAAFDKGAAFWARPQVEWHGYLSPLNALLSINGELGGKARQVLRRALANTHGLDPKHQAVIFNKLPEVLTALLAAQAEANGAEPPPTLEQAAQMGPVDPTTQRRISLFACPGLGCLGACANRIQWECELRMTMGVRGEYDGNAKEDRP